MASWRDMYCVFITEGNAELSLKMILGEEGRVQSSEQSYSSTFPSQNELPPSLFQRVLAASHRTMGVH